MTPELLSWAEELADPDTTCDNLVVRFDANTEDVPVEDLFCLSCGNFVYRHVIKSLLKEREVNGKVTA